MSVLKERERERERERRGSRRLRNSFEYSEEREMGISLQIGQNFFGRRMTRDNFSDDWFSEGSGSSGPQNWNEPRLKLKGSESKVGLDLI